MLYLHFDNLGFGFVFRQGSLYSVKLLLLLLLSVRITGINHLLHATPHFDFF